MLILAIAAGSPAAAQQLEKAPPGAGYDYVIRIPATAPRPQAADIVRIPAPQSQPQPGKVDVGVEPAPVPASQASPTPEEEREELRRAFLADVERRAAERLVMRRGAILCRHQWSLNDAEWVKDDKAELARLGCVRVAAKLNFQFITAEYPGFNPWKVVVTAESGEKFIMWGNKSSFQHTDGRDHRH